MQFMLLFSRQGKLRLQKWYVPLSDKERKKISRDLVQTILARKPKMCSFLEWRDLKIVYKRYASLYFCCAVEDQDNELITLEIIHRYVELLDKYFGSVCELDIIFNFEKAYFILDEFLLGGEAQETSKKNVLKAIEQADLLQEVHRGRGTTERFRRNWADINHHAAASQILFQMQIWKPPCLYPVSSCSLSVLYAYNHHLCAVLLCSVLSSNVFKCGANCGFNVSYVLSSHCILQYFHTLHPKLTVQCSDHIKTPASE
ncbi:hypothetical protein FQN60_011170 [Etheostoma spectabile]|uniref:AP-1 complex subunit sigma-2 n=1 Tax=Etheostoma spectabile TaxID=54343 RepID=A0A5J5DRD3_9PERO|nr:hypothetical protein FQN60_011170 [Etheostoma spectabile]